MAFGPKDLEPKRKEETKVLEKMIDEFIISWKFGDDIYISLNDLPKIMTNLSRIQKLYHKAGWETVDIAGHYLRLSISDYGDK